MSQTSLSATDPRTLPRRSSLMMGTVFTAFLGAVLVLGGRPTTKASSSTAPQIDAKAPIVQVVEQPSGGKLVICGGGKLPPMIRTQFCNLAGGPKAKIVVIPTATSSADDLVYLNHLLDDWRQCGAASVTLLHTRSPEKANDPEFVKPLTDATGVWMTGGDQVCLTDAYLGTRVQKEFKALLDRGGVIGGTSAGAAVMSGVMITGGQTKADIGQGFDLVAGAVIDQHFLKRNRVERLVGVLSAHPNLVGLGIDEQTALVVDVREHHLSVIGDSYVVACVPDSQNRSVRLKFLKAGDQTPLSDLKIPALASTPVLGLGSL